MVVFGAGTERVEAQEPLGVAGAAALVEEFLDVIGVLEVAVALVAAGMGGDEVVGVVEAEAVGKGVEGEALGGVERGHGVAVGVEDDAAAVGDPHQAGDRGVGGLARQRTQGGLFDGEEFGGWLCAFRRGRARWRSPSHWRAAVLMAAEAPGQAPVRPGSSSSRNRRSFRRGLFRWHCARCRRGARSRNGRRSPDSADGSGRARQGDG